MQRDLLLAGNRQIRFDIRTVLYLLFGKIDRKRTLSI
jgi:hypothetical protein